MKTNGYGYLSEKMGLLKKSKRLTITLLYYYTVLQVVPGKLFARPYEFCDKGVAKACFKILKK